MKTIAVISQKGGVGKTTLATGLAVSAELDGKSCALFDLDPQASACFWADRRKQTKDGAETPPVRDVNATRLKFALEAMEKAGADLIVLDCPPIHRDIADAAIRSADMILIPTRAEALDLRAAIETVKVVQDQGKTATVVLTFCPISGAEIDQARQLVAKLGAQLAPVEIHHRKAFARAQQEGQTAQEFEPAGKAAAELIQLYMYACRQLFEVKNGKGRKVRQTA